MEKADERDIIFSRLTYGDKTPAHKEYYKRNPQKLEQDEAFRSKPIMGGEQAVMYDPVLSAIPDACFGFLSDMKKYCDGEVAPTPAQGSAEEFTSILKGLAKYYGAVLTGVAKLDSEHYYSHKGRPSQEYGKEILPDYPHAIVFAVEMERDMIFTAPRIPESVAVTRGYVDAAVIGMILSYYIRALGYNARNNMDGNYIMPMPFVAQSAGLGEIGLNGLLITKDYGPRIRLGAVCTDIPLLADAFAPIGLAEFCKICKRCKTNCPGRAIGSEAKEFNDNSCFTMWQRLGTDCGICMASCPFSLGLSEQQAELLKASTGRTVLLEYFDKHHPKRPYLKENPDWLSREQR